MSDTQTLVIGLTGGIAAGKSTLRKELEKIGFVALDADQISREIVKPRTEGLNAIRQIFGEGYLVEGKLNRKKLGELVFSNSEQLAKLNSILHPLIKKELRRQIENLKRIGKTKILLEVPLLFETGIDALCDYTIDLEVERKTQIARLQQRNGYTYEHAVDRIEAQVSPKFRKSKADLVIENAENVESSKQLVIKYFEKIGMI
ncbi:dephospho-CoA kinase [Ligilactobacillus hayakitensis DSM 18933 = JCM 14209]|uniref:Dephospho-CoA kinase n=1 Tax=Ligilactobacillus hayakitensis DSM 18933 = JCM 14209 TaxID=1423755 RepID=A0A0R1WZ23_9LACO|nr:dephospho-CoA kinase [Ligilactobacillus hayakitensis]KRM19436.1 dephospho-CoA kinase [Ligilactobacillus hayakitensis DSM 18933 = JCM 14209]